MKRQGFGFLTPELRSMMISTCQFLAVDKRDIIHGKNNRSSKGAIVDNAVASVLVKAYHGFEIIC
jgi:hypothetical protein